MGIFFRLCTTKRICSSLCAYIVCAFTAGALYAAEDKLVLVMWEDTLAEEVIELWEKTSGIKVEQIYIDNDEKRDAILSSERTEGIDIIVVDSYAATVFSNTDKFVSLADGRVPNATHIDERWQARCGDEAIPYFWGTLGIVYRKDKIPEPKSWRDFLVPGEELAGHIGMILDSVDTLAPPLAMLGHPKFTEDRAQLQQAFEVLKAQAPNVLTHEYAYSFVRNHPKAPELYAALAYSGDHHSLNEEMGLDDVWQYRVPDEGSLIWVDCLAVLKQSKQKDAALDFLNFINQPEVAALNAEGVEVATPNKAAFALLDEEITGDPSLYPDSEALGNSEVYKQVSEPANRLRTRIRFALQRIYEAK